ncbi:MAG: pitrilysin family protein [Candidatus Omnitrophota bacterium]
MHEITNINGATFIFSPFNDVETASLGVFLKVGSRFEKASLRGISHFLEHMVFKGSKHYSYKAIKQEIEGRGGALNGFTSQESTAYYAHFLNKNLHLTLDILLDMVFYPSLLESDIKKERNVILEEIKMYNDLPSSRAASIIDKLLWPENSLGEEIIGSVSTVTKTQKQDLVAFKNNYYEPGNIIISCSGYADKELVKGLLKDKIVKVSKPVNLKYIAPDILRGVHVKIENKKLEQSHLCMGFRSISYLSSRRFIVEVLNVILGGNMSSRLFEEVREKKALCYEISTDVRKYRDSGGFVIHAGLDKTKIPVAVASILKELEKIKEKKVSDNELTRAKDYILGQITMALERPQGRMFYLAESFLSLGKIYSLAEVKKEIEKISPDDVRSLAQEIFAFKNLCVSCVGDIEDKMGKIIKEKIAVFN